MRRLRIVSNAVLARLAAVGADPRDDEQTRQGKVLLVLTSVLILPIAVVWGSLYLIFGSPVGYVPFLYALILLGAIIAFARTRNFALLLYVSVVDILLAPTLSMVPLGGFLPSGGVGLWGILAPVGALVFSGPRAGLRWFVAYLAVFITSGVAGVPQPRRDHADAVARLALGMLEYVAERKRSGRRCLDFRVGINSGAVIGGVIGRRKFVFDIWGDPVNTAARMESHGEPGKIQMTEATYELLKDRFVCEPRGTIDVKGKGPMRTWWLLSERDQPDRDAEVKTAVAT